MVKERKDIPAETGTSKPVAGIGKNPSAVRAQGVKAVCPGGQGPGPGAFTATLKSLTLSKGNKSLNNEGRQSWVWEIPAL